jgi:outer membrane protein OmpA-like peptidoglycan-associated protein
MKIQTRLACGIALLSSVAMIAISSAHAQQRRGSAVKLPSVEIHLEVLNSLRESVEAKYVGVENTGRPKPRIIERHVGASHTRVPVSPAGKIARVMPLERHKVAGASRLRGEVIMQPLPGVNQVAPKMATAEAVEPTEETIIVQPMPKSQQEFPRVLADVEKRAQEEHPLLLMEEEQAPLEKQRLASVPMMIEEPVQEEEPESSFIDDISNFFSGEEKPGDMPKEPVVIRQPLPQKESDDLTVPSFVIAEKPDAPLIAAAPVATAPVVSSTVVAEEAVDRSASAIGQIAAAASTIEEEEALSEEIAEFEEFEEFELPTSEVAVVPEAEDAALSDLQPLPWAESEPMMQAPMAERVEPEPIAPVVKQEVVRQNPVAPMVEQQIIRPAPVAQLEEPKEIKPQPVTPTVREEIAKAKAVEPKSEYPELSAISQLEEPALERLDEIPTNSTDWINQLEPSEDTSVKVEEAIPDIAEAPAEPSPQPEPANVVEELLTENEPIVVPMSGAELSLLENANQKAPELEEAERPKELPVMEQALAKLEPEAPEPVKVPEVVQEVAKTEEVPELLQDPVLEREKTESGTANEIKKELAELENEIADFTNSVGKDITSAVDSVTSPKPEPVAVAQPVNPPAQPPKEDDSFFPGITQTFKSLLEGDKPETVPAPAPQVVAEVPADVRQTTESVLPPELPIAEAKGKPASVLPSMDLLDDPINDRFMDEELGIAELGPMPGDEAATAGSALPEPSLPPVVSEAALPELLQDPEPVAPIELAALPPEPAPAVPPSSASKGSDLNARITYSVDDTDIPDADKSKLAVIAQQAASQNRRVLISSFASGQEGESKAANMISLSRGLSLRAFFIDNGVPMDQIIVQAKGLENAGGPADRAEIVLD